MSLANLTQADLEGWVAQARQLTLQGRLPDYIPQLAQVDAQLLAVQTIGDRNLTAGNLAQPFVLMSVVKPFLLLFLLEQVGIERVFQQVGTQPSDQPFHSIAQLKLDEGHPRNPMINSGAIALTGLMPKASGTARCEAFRQWLNNLAHTEFRLDEKALDSVRSLPNQTNRTIADLLAQRQLIDRVDIAIDTYNQICCLSGTIADLAKLGLLLAKPHDRIFPVHQQIVSALMLTCGLYEASSAFAVTVGLPMKSGVSGALLAIVPKQGAIACYSPAIDPVGNSVAGIFLIEKLSQELGLSVFR
ncbi:glutaminase [Leptolyngbya sp. FACHB-17]|uniref:glutaminase n=1 Tax=unclassified Leptolyngbya TaxID=2650499 RepID=UPI001680E173|nr:glutaminase [Leptolyngbya sp. FACHB-17]MBD2082727.1 glutaminase [Leptolyngbya sp. FACHB-17]